MSQQKQAKQFRKLFKNDIRDQYALIKQAIRPKPWWIPTFVWRWIWKLMFTDLIFNKK